MTAPRKRYLYPFVGMLPSELERGVRVILEIVAGRLPTKGRALVFVLLARFLAKFMEEWECTIEEAVDACGHALSETRTDDIDILRRLRPFVEMEDNESDDEKIDVELGDNVEDALPTETVVDVDLTIDEDDDVPLVRPRKRVLPLPLREPSLKEKERAAKSVGSLFVQTGGKRGFQLKHTLLPTGSGPWAQICRDQALIWTGRLQAGVEAGTITDKQYDGHQITPEEWNMGGSTPFLSLKLGPDRRSHYQTFSRKQRQRFKEALKGERGIPAVVEGEEKSSNRDILEAELKGNGTKRKRPVVIEEESLISEKDEELKHEVSSPAREIFDVEEEVVGAVEEKTVYVCEDRCPECGGEKDELAQVCPTCMRAGHVPTQDVEEIALPIFELPAPKLVLTFPERVAGKIERLGTHFKEEIETVPDGGDIHVISPKSLFELRPPLKLSKFKEEDRREMCTFAQHLLVAIVKAGIFIFQSKQVFGEGTETVREILSYDLMDLLGLLFYDESIFPGWKLYPSNDMWNVLGIHPPAWESVIKASELTLSLNLKDFLLRKTSIWRGHEGRAHSSPEELEEMKSHVALVARVRLLFEVLVTDLLFRSLNGIELGKWGQKAFLQIERQVQSRVEWFQALNRSRKKTPLTLKQQCDLVNATFIENLRKFLTNHE